MNQKTAAAGRDFVRASAELLSMLSKQAREAIAERDQLLRQKQATAADDKIKTASAAVANELLAHQLITASELAVATTKLASHVDALYILSNLINQPQPQTKQAEAMGHATADPAKPVTSSPAQDHLSRACQTLGLVPTFAG